MAFTHHKRKKAKGLVNHKDWNTERYYYSNQYKCLRNPYQMRLESILPVVFIAEILLVQRSYTTAAGNAEEMTLEWKNSRNGAFFLELQVSRILDKSPMLWESTQPTVDQYLAPPLSLGEGHAKNDWAESFLYQPKPPCCWLCNCKPTPPNWHSTNPNQRLAACLVCKFTFFGWLSPSLSLPLSVALLSCSSFFIALFFPSVA